jgi:hypothetical protein
MATSPIYSWPEPDNTDLVKNGALAIRTLGDAIDTTMGTMVAKTIVDAKADLIVGTAADTVSRLAVGSNGQVLTADSTVSPTGLKWATPAAGGGGKVLQVVSATTTTEVTSSSSTFADTGLTATITPTLSSSKILVLVSQNGCFKDSSNTALIMKLLRGATSLGFLAGLAGYTGTSLSLGFNSVTASYLDSPATTSATTYKTTFASQANSGRAGVQVTGIGSEATMSMITLLEIGA